MRLALLLFLTLLQSAAMAQDQRSSIFAGIDLQQHGITKNSRAGLGDAVGRAQVQVRGARILGARPIEHFEHMVFRNTDEGGEIWSEDHPSHFVCRGACGPWAESLEDWLELAPLPGAGVCPGTDCRIEITASVEVNKKTVHFTTKDFTFRTERLEPPIRILSDGHMIESRPAFDRPQ